MDSWARVKLFKGQYIQYIVVVKEVMCKVCKKLIKTVSHSMGGRRGTKRLCYVDSDDGVPFSKNVWFCNKCWKDIITQVKKDGVFDDK